VRLLFTALVIVGVVYGVYNFTNAAYGWFQVSSLVDEVVKEELAKPGSGGTFAALEARDRFARIRDRIIKGAREARVNLRPENVEVNIVDSMLDVRLAWAAPMVVYGGKTYLEIPMSMQRAFAMRAG
jgi:hypothetical protein